MLDKLGMIAPYEIRMNPLLRGGEPTNTLDEIRALKTMAALPDIQKFDKKSTTLANINSMDYQTIEGIHKYFGNPGLFKLVFLATTSSSQDFEHFGKLITDDIFFRDMWGTQTTKNISYDNTRLCQSRDLDRFCSNVVQPDLARKIYNPGVRPGFLVYGLGGPRILVSHPFRGATNQLYDVYNNSLDVVTSLALRGFYGTFLFLDYLGGLNGKFFDVEGWLLWFSRIAAHSDLVLFVKEEGKPIEGSQKKEVDFTPDRIPKKIVEFPAGELRWAKQYKDHMLPTKILSIVPNVGIVNDEQWQAEELKFAKPFIENYIRGAFPSDRLILIEEGGRIKELPLKTWNQ